MKARALPLVVLLAFATSCMVVAPIPATADGFSVMTWNVRGYPESTSDRRAWFSSVLDEYEPDILCVQEIANADRVAAFLVNESLYVEAAFLDSGDGQDNAVFFSSAFEYVLDAADPNGFFHPAQLAFFQRNGFDAHVLTVHLAWTDTAQRAAERLRLADVTAALLEIDPDLIVAGDFNTTGSAGDTIEELADAAGLVVVYPVNSAGTTCSEARYDYILVSPSIQAGWSPSAAVITFADEDMACAVSDHRPVLAWFGKDPSAASESETPAETPDQAVGVIINEVELDPPGEDSGAEWVEIYNGTEDAVSLMGWSISYTSYCSNGECECWEQLPAVSIPVGGYFVYAYSKRRLHNDNGWSICLRNAQHELVDRTPNDLIDDRNSRSTWQLVSDGRGVSQWVFQAATKGAGN